MEPGNYLFLRVSCSAGGAPSGDVAWIGSDGASIQGSMERRERVDLPARGTCQRICTVRREGPSSGW
jgi:hypothetical protein